VTTCIGYPPHLPELRLKRGRVVAAIEAPLGEEGSMNVAQPRGPVLVDHVAVAVIQSLCPMRQRGVVPVQEPPSVMLGDAVPGGGLFERDLESSIKIRRAGIDVDYYDSPEVEEGRQAPSHQRLGCRRGGGACAFVGHDLARLDGAMYFGVWETLNVRAIAKREACDEEGHPSKKTTTPLNKNKRIKGSRGPSRTAASMCGAHVHLSKFIGRWLGSRGKKI
jgi:hypothetical protein